MSKLQVGRELDALVAEKVFRRCMFSGTGEIENRDTTIAEFCTKCGEPRGYHAIPRYSTDIAAAWKLVEKFQMSVAPVTLHLRGKWCVAIMPSGQPYNTWVVAAETAPLAICRAALEVVKQQEKETVWITEPGWRYYDDGRIAHVCKPNQAPVDSKWIVDPRGHVAGISCPKCFTVLSNEKIVELANKCE